MSPKKLSVNSNLNTLSQTPSTWVVAVRKLGFEAPLENGNKVEPYLVIVTDIIEELFLAMEPLPERPTSQHVGQVLFDAMRKPGETRLPPQRPNRVLFEQEELLHELTAPLWEIGVATGSSDPLPIIDQVVSGLNESLGGMEQEAPGLLSVAGVSPNLVSRFFSAAAEYYRRMPWTYLNSFGPIAVNVDPPNRDCFIQVMGDQRENISLGIYESWDIVLKVFEQANGEDWIPPEGGIISLMYIDKDEFPSEDLQAVKRYGWKVANRKAYPFPIVLHPERPIRPDRGQIILLEALLRTLPLLADETGKQYGNGDNQEFNIHFKAQTADGPVQVSYRTLDPEQVSQLQAHEEEDAAISIDLSGDGEESYRLVTKAWNEDSGEKGKALALEAINLFPDNADAYLFLSYQAETNEEMLRMLDQAIAAGERLTEDYTDEYGDILWEVRQARSYLLAKRERAEIWLYGGRIDEAHEEFKELLELDIDDHVGARFFIYHILLRQDQDEILEENLDIWEEEENALSVLLRALLSFRRKGNNPEARKLINRAGKLNPKIIPMLIGAQPLPDEPVKGPGPTQEEEAVFFAANYFVNWYSTPGAIEWLKKHNSIKGK